MSNRQQSWFDIMCGKKRVNHRQAENGPQALHRFFRSWGLHAASDKAKGQYTVRRSRDQGFVRLPDNPRVGRKMSRPELKPYRLPQ